MPIAIIKCVRYVSSEDSFHVAANILSPDMSKKWKTKSVGDKSAQVILELEEPHEITGIDIGNEHSAFVEVLVGKGGNTEDDFSEILITCSFMTPIESKNSTNTNRVRCFGQNALVGSKLATKWQLIKIFCTQPFNKHVQFGLSFIKIHVSENVVKKTLGQKTSSSDNFKRTLQNECKKEAKKKKLGLGKFALREDSPDSDSESVAGLFSRWKMNRQKKGDETLSIASAIREASSSGLFHCLSDSSLKAKPTLNMPYTISHSEHCSVEPHLPDRHRVGLIFGNENQSDKLPKKNLQTQILKQQLKKDFKTLGSGEEVESNTVITLPLEKQTSTSGEKPGKYMEFRPFNKLLDGVVLVISGIQNPNRADLRNKAVAMGARYKGDWESGCTHLICAFKNTPKYNQVRGKGKIVTSKWIERCYESKKYFPWRRFALDNEQFDKSESDEEIFDESKRHLTFDEYCNKDFTEDNGRKLQVEIMDSSSENDTDDDIERAVSSNLQRNIAKRKPNILRNEDEVTKERESIYEVLTEEEDFLKDKYMSYS